MLGDIPRADADRARGGFLQPRDHPQQRGFAAARGADEDAELAILDLEVNPVDHLHVAEALDDLF